MKLHKNELPTIADKSGPKLHLVKGSIYPEDIYEQIGLSNPKEINTSSYKTNKSEISEEHLKALEDVQLFRLKKINATELKNRHSDTYTNWSNMKSRCKADSHTGVSAIELHSSFEAFPDFLEIMGPRPEPTWSLDRIDPTGMYSPDNVHWASKTTQSRNRTNSVRLTSKGITRPLVEWAEILNLPANTLRQRKRLGWSDEEIIKGIRNSGYVSGNNLNLSKSRNPFDYTPWPFDLREPMEREYQRRGGSGHRLAFMERYATEMLRKIAEVAEEISWPDDPEYYTPTQDEIDHLERLNKKQKIFQSMYWDAKKMLSAIYPVPLYKQRHLPEWVESHLANYG